MLIEVALSFMMPHSSGTKRTYPEQPVTPLPSGHQDDAGLQAAMVRFGRWLKSTKEQAIGAIPLRANPEELEAKRQAQVALKKLTTITVDTPQQDIKHLIQTASSLKDVWHFLLRKMPEHFSDEAPLLWLGLWTIVENVNPGSSPERQDIQLRFCSPRKADFEQHPVTVASDFRSNHFLQTWQKQDTQFSCNPWQLGLQDILPDYEVYPQDGSTPPRLNVFSIPLLAGGQTIAMVSMGISAIDANAQAALGYLYDIRNHFAQLTWNLLLQERMAQQALCDPLTGLLSYSHFQAELARHIQRADDDASNSPPLTLLILDINRLHQVNKAFGFGVGDALLQSLSHELLQAAHDSNTQVEASSKSIAARFGSDELVFLATNFSDDKLQLLISKLKDCVEHHPLAKQHGLTISIGSASLPNAAYPNTALLAVAETSLAVAKQQSKANHTSVHLDSRELLQTSPQKVLDAWAAHAVEQVALQTEVSEKLPDSSITDNIGSLEALVRYVETRDEGYSATMSSPMNPMMSPTTSTPDMLETIHSLSGAMNAKDQYTDGHAYAVTRYAIKLAKAIGFDEKQIETIRLAAMLHDIGKIGIPESILCKPGPLTDDEWDIMKQHPVIGARKILAPISGLRDILPMVEHHHEHWDGTGHPMGLKGDAIPLGARIVAIVDTFHALTSNRCYRKALPLEQAKQILTEGAGRLWDPELIDVFLKLLSKEPVTLSA